MINFKQFFSYDHLFTPATEPMHFALYFFVIFGLSLLVAIYLFLTAKSKPIKFQKTFSKRMGDGLFYLPTLMILYIFIRRGGLEMASQRIIFLILLFGWLIWLVFLIYYRLAVISKLYLEYNKRKREEKYIRHGKN
jgi:uncharacterized membrane protein